MDIDYDLVIRQLLKSVRGKDSQESISRKLKLSGSQYYRWESGRQSISWDLFVQICKLKKVDLEEPLKSHYGGWEGPASGHSIFNLLAKSFTQKAIAEKMQISRYRLHNLKSGKGQPTLKEILFMMQTLYYSLHLFMHKLLGEQAPACLKKEINRQLTMIRLLEKEPMAGAYSNVFTLKSYHELKRHSDAFCAKKLEIDLKKSKYLREQLEQCGLIEKQSNGLYRRTSKVVHLGNSVKASKNVLKHWNKKGLEKVNEFYPSRDHRFGYAVMAIREDQKQEMLNICRDFTRKIYDVLDDPNPGRSDNDAIVVMQMNIMTIGD